jgi:thioredoxin-like negative regulator of GroEL
MPLSILSLMELQEARETAKSNDCPLLVQCGSPKCQLCPAFTAEVQKLAIEYKFHYVYINTHAAEEDLIDEIQVARLPAYILETQTDVHKQQAAKPENVREVVSGVCKPVLLMDCDF